MRDGLVVVHQHSRQSLLARHLGRAVLVSTHGDARSCWQARRLSEAFGPQLLKLLLMAFQSLRVSIRVDLIKQRSVIAIQTFLSLPLIRTTSQRRLRASQ